MKSTLVLTDLVAAARVALREAKRERSSGPGLLLQPYAPEHLRVPSKSALATGFNVSVALQREQRQRLELSRTNPDAREDFAQNESFAGKQRSSALGRLARAKNANQVADAGNDYAAARVTNDAVERPSGS